VAIRLAREAMESAARDLDFTAAARYRDQMYALQERQKEMQGTASDKRPGPKK
jgi:excinuclease ABC subunit B